MNACVYMCVCARACAHAQHLVDSPKHQVSFTKEPWKLTQKGALFEKRPQTNCNNIPDRCDGCARSWRTSHCCSLLVPCKSLSLFLSLHVSHSCVHNLSLSHPCVLALALTLALALAIARSLSLSLSLSLSFSLSLSLFLSLSHTHFFSLCVSLSMSLSVSFSLSLSFSFSLSLSLSLFLQGCVCVSVCTYVFIYINKYIHVYIYDGQV